MNDLIFRKTSERFCRVRKSGVKLTAEHVKHIREEWEKTPRLSVDAVASNYGVSISTIDAIVKRRTWKQVF